MNPEVAQTLLDKALALHRDGDPDAALPLYTVVARAFPEMVELRRLIGLAEVERGQPAAGVLSLRRCLALHPAHAPALCGLGTALRALGQLTAGVRALVRARVLDPANANFQANLGYALLEAGNSAAAAGILRAAAAGDPDDVQSWLALGEAFSRQDQAEAAGAAARVAVSLAPALAAGWLAVDAPRRAVHLDPWNAEARVRLADDQRQRGRASEALAILRRALALDPAHPGAWRVASSVAGEKGPALRALVTSPTDAEAWVVLALGELAAGLAGAAQNHLGRALALAPSSAHAHNNLGAALLASRHPERAAGALERAARLAGVELGAAASNHLLALNYLPSIGDDALAEAHRRWGAARLAAAQARPSAAPIPARNEKARLRLGYVSPNLKRHPVGYFLAGVLENHDRHRFEAICYNDTQAPDDLTARLRAAADGWRESGGWNDGELEAAIRADGIDVLVDLAGHTAGNRLGVFAAKPAPLQISWLGYFHTTGLPTIDAVLTDADSVPAEFRHWFGERVVTLAEGRFCYAPPADAPPVAPPPLAANGWPMFGSFNNLAKLGDEVLDLWAELLKRVDGARLSLKWHTLGEAGTRRAIIEAFVRRGVDPARLILTGGSDHASMLAQYATIDVALDPFPFNGCLTTLEALWMGVPVVTLAGHRPVARQSLAILRRVGQEDAIATTPAQFLEIAARLVADPAALAARRAGSRARVAARLCDAKAFTRALEAALAALWRPAPT